MRLAAHIFMVFLSLGFFFLTYNFVTLIIHSRESSPRKRAFHEQKSQLLIDPVIRIPGYAKTKNQNILFHVALTATDTPYSKWQCRIMYYWYKKKKDLPGSEMGKLTRILHSGNSDNLMDEIPTFVVDPLPPGFDRVPGVRTDRYRLGMKMMGKRDVVLEWLLNIRVLFVSFLDVPACVAEGYVVLNRPWAFVQWLEKSTIEEKYILMAEPDHIFLKPLPNLGYEDYPAAYPFFYIKPKEHENIIRKFFPEEMGPVTHIDPIGNSPVIIKKDLLEEIAPTWMNVSIKMKMDPETDKTFGWVLEMYAYAVASALHGVQHILWENFMLQPPWDLDTANKFILHFTYGCDYNLKGKLTYGKTGEWRFDKRTYLDGPPPRNLSLPPPGVPESVVTLVKMINEATANLPNWVTTQ